MSHISLGELFPPLNTFITFLAAGLALNIVPGADLTFVAVSAGRGGWRAGFAAALGIGVGCFAHIAFAAVGLSALIAASSLAFALVKYAGAAYLLYLAINLVRAGGPTKAPEPPLSPRDAFRRAVAVNVLNPKVGIFFLAFLPQFITPGALAGLKVAVLGLVFDFTGTCVNVAVALIVAFAAGRFKTHWLPRVSRYFAASLMGALALRLALAPRQ